MGFPFNHSLLPLLLLFLLLALPRGSSDEVEVLTVDVHSTKGLVGSGHRYLDVRTVEEFTKGQINNSLNVPYMFFTPQGRVKNTDFVKHVSSLCNKDDHILVGCQSGVRSLEAAADLLNTGFKNVKNVGGGYAAWVENGFDIHKPEQVLPISVEPPQSKEATNVDVHATKYLLGTTGHRYLDVRTENEFKNGYLENSLNVPYVFFTPEGGRVKNQDFVEHVSLVCNKEDDIIVGCLSGVRSLQAMTDLRNAGFKNVKNMEGGYAAWVSNGFAVKNLEAEL